MTKRPPFIAAFLSLLMAGCSPPVQRQSYFVRPAASADGNVDESGNVFVHISNQGSQGYLLADFEISRPDGSGRRMGRGAVEYDSIGGWVFAYSLPPGQYQFKFDDGIGDEDFPWAFPFTVPEAGRKVHLDLSYYLRERERGSDGEPRLYEPTVEFEVADRAPARF